VVDIADNIHVVWVEKAGETDPAEVYYKNSMDAGSSWSAPKRLTWTTGDTFQPCIRADSNNRLYVVFHDYTSGNAEVYFKKSTDGGSTWMAMKRLTWNSGASVFPTMAVDSNDNIRLTWIDTTSGNSEIYYRHSLDKGSTWSAVKRLTWNSGISTRPFVITDPSNAIHIFWDDDTPGRREIYYKKSSDGGLNWSGLKRLTWTTGHSQEANAAIGPGTNHLYLVWHDFTNNSEIYFKESTNGGSTWLPLKRITWNAGLTFHPNVAVDSNQYVHLVYDDRGPGNYEIFYRNRK
jgi:hypothetical protein